MRLLIVGCGYVGYEVRKSVPGDWTVFALTRTHERVSELREQGIAPVVGDWIDEESLSRLPEVDHVLVSVPHRSHGGLEERSHEVGLQNLLERLPGCWKKLVYLSTTGVYGDCRDEIVDEQTPVSPTRIGPRIAVAGESWLRDNVSPAELVVLRLAGIYGPGRIPLARKLKDGQPLAVPRDGFLNLAHVADIAHIVVRLFQCSPQQALYVFSDGQPVPRLEFYTYLAELCGVADPRFVDPEPTDARTRRASRKRVNPTQIVQELRYEYLYPDYRAGLRDALQLN